MPSFLASLLTSSFLYCAVGNRRFRDLIAASTDKYNDAKSRLEKSMVVHYIVEEVKKINGRFLKQDRFSGKWYELDERQAKEKVGHAIRDATSSIDPKKKTLKKTRSKSSTTSSPSTKDSPFDTSNKEASDSESSLTVPVSSMSQKIQEDEATEDDKTKSLDPWDDLAPLRVDSLEARNSFTELQRDDSFLHWLSVVLGATETEDSGPLVVRRRVPFRFEVV